MAGIQPCGIFHLLLWLAFSRMHLIGGFSPGGFFHLHQTSKWDALHPTKTTMQCIAMIQLVVLLLVWLLSQSHLWCETYSSISATLGIPQRGLEHSPLDGIMLCDMQFDQQQKNFLHRCLTWIETIYLDFYKRWVNSCLEIKWKFQICNTG